MNLPPGSDPTRRSGWRPASPTTRCPDTYPMIMRILMEDCIIELEDMIDALPADADMMETLGLNVYAVPDRSMYVSDCPNHYSRQGHFLTRLPDTTSGSRPRNPAREHHHRERTQQR